MRAYRGKTFGSKKWYYGSHVRIGNRHFIVNPDAGFAKCECGEEFFAGYVEVIPETVGQSIGLCDKNGKEIYEGDIIRTHFDKTILNDAYDEIGQVLLLGNLFNGFGIEDVKRCIHYEIYSHSEVIGDIHLKPELIGKSK